MRKAKYFRNSVYSFISFTILLFISLLNRKFIIQIIGSELLGYEGLFSNIFAILSIFELGFSNIITYNLFREVASKNTINANKFIEILKKFNKIVSIVIISVGFLVGLYIFFIGNIKDLKIILLYFTLLITSVMPLLVLHIKIVFITNQNEYIVTKAETINSIIFVTLRLLVLILTSNYYYYLIIILMQFSTINILLFYLYIKNISVYKKKVIFKEGDIDKLELKKDLISYIFHKLSYLIYSSSDNIVIFFILGVDNIVMFGNYILIKSQLINGFLSFLKPLQATLGNLIYSSDFIGRERDIFNFFIFISFCIASTGAFLFFVFIDPIISFWLGNEYLLDNVFVFVLCINIYLLLIQEVVFYFRNTIGKYNLDRNILISFSFLNLMLSIILSKELGYVGLLIGTNVSLIGVFYSRLRIVVNEIFTKLDFIEYINKHIILLIIFIVELLGLFFIAKFVIDFKILISFSLIICYFAINFKILETLNMIVLFESYLEIVRVKISKILNLI